jgi:hypothetical protein
VYPNGEVVEVERSLPEPGTREYDDIVDQLKV